MTRSQSCLGDLPTGTSASPDCDSSSATARTERKRSGRRTVATIAVILILAILSYQMAVPLVGELTKTESQRMIVVAKDIGKEWSSTEPVANEDFLRPVVEGDYAHVRLHHHNATSEVYIDCVLMIYEDNETANQSYALIGSDLQTNNTSMGAADLGDHSELFMAEDEGAEGWLRSLLVVEGLYVVYIEAKELGPTGEVDLSLLLEMGEAQLEKLA